LAPVFPSERRATPIPAARFVTTDALRDGLAEAVAHHLPPLSPHLLRPRFAASDLPPEPDECCCHSRGFGSPAALNTTMIYVHADNTHIEQARPAPAGGPSTGSEADDDDVESADGRRAA